MCILIAAVGFVVQAVVVGEVVGAHREGAQPRVVGQGKRERRRFVRLLSVLIDEVTHAGEVRGVGVERGGDGTFEGDGSMGVEQLDESADEDAEVVVALGGGDEQGLGRRGGVVEAVGGAVLAGETLVAFELFDVGGVLDLLAPVDRARMGGEDGAGVEDAHGLQRGRDEESSSDVAVRDGVVVAVESHVGRFADLHLDTFFAGEGVVGELEQVGAFLGEDLGDGALSVLGTGAFGGASPAPLIGLVIEVVEVVESPGAEEALTGKADEPFHPAFGEGCQLQPIRTVSSRLYASPIPSTRYSGVASSC